MFSDLEAVSLRGVAGRGGTDVAVSQGECRVELKSGRFIVCAY